MTLKQRLTGIFAAALALVMGSSSPIRAQTAEVMSGNKSSALDLKVGADIAPRTGIFFGGITTADYNNEVSTFGLADLSFRLLDGLDAVYETQFLSGPNGVIPRGGFTYSKDIGKLSLFVEATAGRNTAGKPDGEFVAIVGYEPRLSRNVSLSAKLQDVTNIGSKGHNFSSQQIRIGPKFVKKYGIGFAANVAESDGERDTNVGGYAGVDF